MISFIGANLIVLFTIKMCTYLHAFGHKTLKCDNIDKFRKQIFMNIFINYFSPI